MALPDAESVASLGGTKVNYGVAPVDPSTDVSSSNWNDVILDVASMSRVCPRSKLAFTWTGTAVSVTAYEAMWKGGTATVPTGIRTGTGSFTFTYPATVTDENGGTHSVNLTSATGWAEGSTLIHVQASASANVVTVYTFNAAGTLTDSTNTVVRFEVT